MILELVATCLLGAGMIYTPPDGWRVEQVGIMGAPNACTQRGFMMDCMAIVVTPIDHSYVIVRRTAKIGETIEAPPGCTLRAETKP